VFSAPRKELNRFDFSLQEITRSLPPRQLFRARRAGERKSGSNSISRGNSAPFYLTPNCLRRAAFKRRLFKLIASSAMRRVHKSAECSVNEKIPPNPQSISSWTTMRARVSLPSLFLLLLIVASRFARLQRNFSNLLGAHISNPS